MFQLSRLQDLREHFRYRLDNLFARGTAAQLLLLIGASGLVVLVGMSAGLLGLFGTPNAEVEAVGHQYDEGVADSFWWSIQHVLDPSFFGANYGATLPVVVMSFALSIAGLMIFGTLIGFVSSAIEDRLASLRKGNSPVKERQHLLILGWNDKIYSILALLGESRRATTVVVLSHHDSEYMQTQIRTEVQVAPKVRVVFRTGAPTNLVELERVAFDKAFNIIVLADESAPAPAEDPDIRVIKTLILLSSFQGWEGARPKMAAEIMKRGYYQAASIATGGEVRILNSSETISRLLVQASRQPAVSIVYREIFRFSGSEIYVAGFPQGENRKFGELWPKFGNAIPIGVSRRILVDGRESFVPHLNPGRDYVVGKGEWLIFITAGRKIAFDENAPAFQAVTVAPVHHKRPRQHAILVLGWNESVYDILCEFDQYLDPGTPIRVVANYTPEVAAELMAENLTEPLRNIRYAYVRANYSKREHLSALLKDSEESVILLADRSAGDHDPDARTIITLLSLREILRERGETKKRPIATEFLSAQNAELLTGENLGDVVISPEMVSMVLTQISQQLMLQIVYEELLNAGENEIYLRPPELYTPHPENCTFADLSFGALQREEIAIGLRLDRHAESRDDNFGVVMNPDKSSRLNLTEADRVVVIARDL